MMSKAIRFSVLFTLFAATVSIALAADKTDIYDTKADGRAQIDDALAEANEEGKRVLITWGANWCGWCHHLKDQIASDEQITEVLDKNYIAIRIDLGHRDKHMDLAREYELEFDDLYIPHMTVLDADGDIVGDQNPEDLAVDAPEGSPQSRIYSQERILEFLTKNRPKKVAFVANAADTADIYDTEADGRAQLDAAVAKAKVEGKHVLITWGANWCGWCHNVSDQFKTSEDLKAVVEESFVHIKIDLGHRDKHMDLARELGLDFDKLGIPHMTVLDEQGEVIANAKGGELSEDVGEGNGYKGSKWEYTVRLILVFLKENVPVEAAD